MSAAIEQMALSLIRRIGIDPKQLFDKYGTVIDEFRTFDARAAADSVRLARVERNLAALMVRLGLEPETENTTLCLMKTKSE